METKENGNHKLSRYKGNLFISWGFWVQESVVGPESAFQFKFSKFRAINLLTTHKKPFNLALIPLNS